MHIIARRILLNFSAAHPDAKGSVDAWFREVKAASWQGPLDIKQSYSTASILRDNRVVFNIRGGNYRLVVRVNYHSGTVFVRFLGGHDEYDGVDGETI
jgi:mRNA interferase HigB